MWQDRIDHPGTGGERLDVLEVWRGEVVLCTRGLVVLPKNHQRRVSRFGPQTELEGTGQGKRDSSAAGSFKAGYTRSDHRACVGGKQGHGGCVSTR
jgi:hypothetical protein